MPKALRCANGSPTPVAPGGDPHDRAGSSLLEQQDRAASRLRLNLNVHNGFFTIEIDCYITEASWCCANPTICLI